MFYNLKKSLKGKRYKFFSPLGWLVSREVQNESCDVAALSLPQKAVDALKFVENPYLITPLRIVDSHHHHISTMLKLYAYLLIWLYHNFYFGLWVISHLRLSVFEDSCQAINAFREIHPQNQKVLCLPRSIFAATLSRRFKNHGVMVIGAFLPSRHLHAFIIEDSRNPCNFDNAWINYTPIAVMS